MIPVAVPLLTASERLDARRLVRSQGLGYEEGCEDIVGIYDEGRLVATAARSGYVLKMFAVDPSHQAGDAVGILATALTTLGRAAGHDACFVFTRPEHAASFERCQFRLLAASGSAALLECGGGLERYLAGHAALRRAGVNGAVVINGNPFTRGHQSLVERAAAEVDHLYLFVVREDRSVFPFAARYRLAEASTRHVPNRLLLDTSRYAVSAGTFPSYFLRQDDEKARLQMEVDARLFATRLAPAFGITKRFVGHEPYCETTASYNRTMAEVLPACGVELVEVPRTADGGRFISATDVRAALAAGDMATVERLVPPPTLEYLRSPEGRAIASSLEPRASSPEP
jgi:[citrate (pro-3S)-lyase] ligase